jgi:putative ABC transport system ATP-binding protein
MIEAINLVKIYNFGKKNQVEAVSDVSINAEKGQITALIGPSGCGKSTLMSVIGQLLTPTSGKVLVDGEDITSYSDGWKAVFRRNNVGFVFQHINLLPNLNALDNVITPLLCHDKDPQQYKKPALELLDQLGLADRAYFNVEQLSGGQQQRVAVARALITEPKIVVADEPLTFVDEASAKKITDFFVKLKKDGKTVLISTHVSNLAKLADKTYEMKDGKIIKSF